MQCQIGEATDSPLRDGMESLGVTEEDKVAGMRLEEDAKEKEGTDATAVTNEGKAEDKGNFL